MKAVLTRPEARPERDGSTSLMAASSMGLKATPAPSPSSTIAGSTSSVKLPSMGAREQRQSQGRQRQPQASGPRMPKRITSSRQAQREHGHDQVAGQKGQAHLHGVIASTRCM